MKERLKKVLPWVLYPLFYVIALLVFAVLTFPVDKMKDAVVSRFNARQRATGGSSELRIKDASRYWITGVKATDVRMVTLPTDPTKPPTEIRVDEARANVSLVRFLTGTLYVSYSLTAFGGTAEGSYAEGSKERTVDVTLDGLELGQLDPLVQAVGLPLEGKLSGKVKLTMPEGKASKGSGTIQLEARDVAIGDGKAKIKNTLALPKLVVGELSLTAEAKDGQIKITKLSAGGKDVEIQGEGRITMREMATESLCDVSLRFKVNDAYRTKNDLTKSLFGAPGSSMPALFEMDPQVKASKRPDGFYGWALRGPLGRLKTEPAGGGGSAPFPMPGLGSKPAP